MTSIAVLLPDQPASEGGRAIDGLEIEIEGDSDAAVALALLKIAMRAEGKDEDGASADWILATYKRCMTAVAGDFLRGR